ncbi:transmembrane protein 53-like [Littorina saxatilis]|uniref:Uncharacterized protein n=1 Tax=Littorina saxatilis TaxID=31220 RepID=A0AAN9B2W9_9CAEN
MAASLVLICRRGRDTAMSVCAKHSSILSSAARWLSGGRSSPSVIKRNVEGFELTSIDTSCGQQPRPVVVLIGWLNAKRKHLRKYQEVYWDRGFDVLTMDVTPVHIVRPRAGIKYTHRLLKALQENDELSSRQVVVHGFSIGAFIYTQLQLLLHQQREAPRRHQPLRRVLQQDDDFEADLGERIAGLVMDSPAYMDHMCHGIANSLTHNPAARKLISRSLLLYLAAFPRSVTHHYQESHRMFHHNTVPTLILYSPADLISSADTSERYVKEWRAKGYPVSTCKFQDSTHVGHYRDNPEKYVAALHSFLDTLELAQQKAAVEIPQAAAAAAEV